MIGIITRKDLTPSNQNAYITYKSIVDIINYNKEVAIGIIPGNIEKVKKVIDLCDGIILEGGNNMTTLDLDLIKYIYDKNIPCLGICLGMQEMAYLFNGKIGHILNNSHISPNNYAHKVIIQNSNIYDNSFIKVNSRHKDCILDTSLEITGRSEDNIIEMVEDKSKKFFVGVEWHPENLYYNDHNSRIIFNTFFFVVKNKI